MAAVILVALGLIASTSNAQAGEFQIEGKAALLATVTGKQEGKLSLSIPELDVLVECSEGSILTAGEILNAKEGLVKMLFSGCLALSYKKGTKLPCTVDDLESTLRMLPVSHAGNAYVLFQPDGTELLTTILLLGVNCPLPNENPIKGSVVGQVTTNHQVVDLITFSPAIQQLVGDKLTYGPLASFITGSITLELTGAHAGLEFGVV
jgi:hypothetical protein